MTIQEQYAQYEIWVATTPKIFVVDNTNKVLTSAGVGDKVVEVTTANGSVATSVRIENNAVTLDGFLAWSEQICGC